MAEQLPSNPGKFTDATAELGINFQYQASDTSKKYLLETIGSGVALFDYDNDGGLDIFFVNGAPLDDPEATGAVLARSRTSVLEPSITLEAGRNFRKSRTARFGLRHGSGNRRLR